MFTVAIIGSDGAGKTAVARALDGRLEAPVTYLYMGVNPEASTHTLPTTRIVHAMKRSGGTRGGGAATHATATVLSRARKSIRSALRVVSRLAEEWYRQTVAWRHRARGRIVVYDRHFVADYLANDVNHRPGLPWGRRLHGFLLSRVYPTPDVTVYLDASPAVLLARKGEGTLDSLARRRQAYLKLAKRTPNFVVVDAEQPLGKVVSDVCDVLATFSRTRQVVGFQAGGEA
jgi:thymidylate kinase